MNYKKGFAIGMRKFIIGSDWWSDCDDAVAMRLLARAHKRGEIEIAGICLNACMEHSFASLEAFLNTEGICKIPIGLDSDAVDFGGILTYQKNLIKFTGPERSNRDAENALAFYRRLLTESEEKLEIIEIGFLQVVAALLLSEGDEISPKTGLELVREKVSKFWVMAEKWDEDGGVEHNFANNSRAARGAAEFCKLCPVPVTFLGFEVGVDVISGNLLKEGDVLREVLTDHGSAQGRPSWDPMLAMLAMTGDEERSGYAVVQGTASVDSITGENHFSADSNGLHRYVVKKKENSFYQNEINARL